MLKHYLYIIIKSPNRKILLHKEQMLEHTPRIGFLVSFAGKNLAVSDVEHDADEFSWYVAFETLKVKENEFDKVVKDFKNDGWRMINEEEIKWYLDFEGGYL